MYTSGSVKKTVLVLDPISLGILGFSPLLLSVIGKNNSNGELKLNSNYYNSHNGVVCKRNG